MGRGVFLNVSGGGHVIATYGMVGELVARGETITYYEAPKFQRDIEALGADWLDAQRAALHERIRERRERDLARDGEAFRLGRRQGGLATVQVTDRQGRRERGRQGCAQHDDGLKIDADHSSPIAVARWDAVKRRG